MPTSITFQWKPAWIPASLPTWLLSCPPGLADWQPRAWKPWLSVSWQSQGFQTPCFSNSTACLVGSSRASTPRISASLAAILEGCLDPRRPKGGCPPVISPGIPPPTPAISLRGFLPPLIISLGVSLPLVLCWWRGRPGTGIRTSMFLNHNITFPGNFLGSRFQFRTNQNLKYSEICGTDIPFSGQAW